MKCKKCDELMRTVGFVDDQVIEQCMNCGMVELVEQEDFVDDLLDEARNFMNEFCN